MLFPCPVASWGDTAKGRVTYPKEFRAISAMFRRTTPGITEVKMAPAETKMKLEPSGAFWYKRYAVTA